MVEYPPDMNAFAILGRQPAISIAEIEAARQKPIDQASDQVAIFEMPEDELFSLQNRLGGTRKVGIVMKRSTGKTLTGDLEQILRDVQTQDKLVFGISVYDLGDAAGAKQLRARSQAMGLELKKRLKAGGQSVRLLTSKEETLSSVIVTKNRLTEPGRIEIMLLVSLKEVLIGRTAAVQDFEDWSHRDYDRPARDAKRGMLPPKLARMMINLAGVDPEGKVLLDPFCGSGTVLMEGAMLGCGRLIGSDASKAAVRDTRTNLDWLRTQGVHMPPFEISMSRAAEMTAEADLIVTEPFLGKPRSGKETKEEIEEMLDELEVLYRESFTNLKKSLKSKGIAVIAFPIHFDKKKVHLCPDRDISEPFTKWQDLLKSCGFEIIDESLLYRRPDQFVGRQILRAKSA